MEPDATGNPSAGGLGEFAGDSWPGETDLEPWPLEEPAYVETDAMDMRVRLPDGAWGRDERRPREILLWLDMTLDGRTPLGTRAAAAATCCCCWGNAVAVEAGRDERLMEREGTIGALGWTWETCEGGVTGT